MGIIWQIALTYIGAVVGAGFASGQEILQFFAIFGGKGLWGAALASGLFALVGGELLILAREIKAKSYQMVLYHLCGHRLGRIYDLLLTGFLFVGLAIMLSGSGRILTELGLIDPLGPLVMALLVGGITSFGNEGLLGASLALVPWLLGGCFALLCFSAASPAHGVVHVGTFPPWWFAALLYVSYNMGLALAVLTSLAEEVPPRQARLAGLLGGLGLGAALGACTLTLLLMANPYGEFPLLDAAALGGPIFQGGYALILWAAMLTTALANTNALAGRLTILKAPWRGVALCLAALPWTTLGFSRLIALFYPLYGYLGLFLLVLLLTRRWR